MSCKGCGKDKQNYTMYDRHGNVIKGEKPEEVVEEVVAMDGDPAKNKTIQELLKDRTGYREFVEKAHEDLLDDATDDMKRMMLIELLSIYNHEELSMTRMSPTQALVALWKYLHNEKFKEVLTEFPGLMLEVDERYGLLRKNFIKSNWAYI